jgi:diacylglycerol kinase
MKTTDANNGSWIRKHIASYGYAFRGIYRAFRYEANMLFHLAGAFGVVVLNYMLNITRTEWLFTLILIGLVWMAEVFNTAIEKLADRVTEEHDSLIGHAKDLAAGAVLIICGFAVLCALIIYFPYVI